MTPNSEFVIDHGATVRGHRYLSEIRLFLAPAIMCICMQTLIYVFFIWRAGRNDWSTVAFIFALVPLASGLVLTAFRRHQFPITSAMLVTIVFFSVAISFISALRIPTSYVGLTLCIPITTFIIATANVRLQSKSTDATYLIPFDGAENLAKELNVGLADDNTAADVILIDPMQGLNGDLLTKYYMQGTDIVPWTRYMEIKFGRVDINTFNITHIRLSPAQIIYSKAKRILDVLFVLSTLPITTIMMAAVAGYIKITSGGPVIFEQSRRGYGGRTFTILKFRTMHANDTEKSTDSNDTRLIRGGRIIRRLRLDELPQLLNVVKGEMSLIGPRPVAEYVADAAEAAEPKYKLRTLVAPGLTGWAQVRYPYASSTEEEIIKLSYDLYYIKYQSFDLDLEILARTIKTVFTGKGAR